MSLAAGEADVKWIDEARRWEKTKDSVYLIKRANRGEHFLGKPEQKKKPTKIFSTEVKKDKKKNKKRMKIFWIPEKRKTKRSMKRRRMK